MDLLITFLLIIVLEQTTSEHCDSYGCYINMGATRKFTKAKEICKMTNKTLLHVENAEMANNVLSYFQVDLIWLDYQVNIFDKMKWLDDQDVVDFEELGDDYCTYLSQDITDQIYGNTAPCHQKLMFLCSSSNGCKDSQTCHATSASGATWFQARNICRKEGRDLYIPGKSSDPRKLDMNYTTKYWVGARRISVLLTEDNREAIYTNWAKEQPADPTTKTCVVMNKMGEWCTTLCLSQYINYTVICYQEATGELTDNTFMDNIVKNKIPLLTVAAVVITAILTAIVLFIIRRKMKFQTLQNQENGQTQNDVALYDVAAKMHNDTTYDHISDDDNIQYATPYEPQTDIQYDTEIYDNPIYGQTIEKVYAEPNVQEKEYAEPNVQELNTGTVPRKPPRIFADCPEFEICENEIYHSGLNTIDETC